jgi:restriction system protein
MARKNDGIFWHLLDAPWWLSVLFSAVTYFGLAFLLPELAARSDNFFFKALVANIPQLANIFAFILLIPAPIAFFKQWLREDNYSATTFEIRKLKNTNPLNSLTWIEFESYLGEYFKQQGFHVKQSFSKSADGGVDIWLTKNGELSLVQCKHWKSRKVGVQVLREMYGVMIDNRASKMIIVTSGDFTSEAIDFALEKRMWLINGSELVHLIEKGRNFMDKKVIAEPTPEADFSVCPRCQSRLVVRVAKRGRNVGKNFYGCSAYPRCHYTCDFLPSFTNKVQSIPTSKEKSHH